jgi:hypothetical protein
MGSTLLSDFGFWGVVVGAISLVVAVVLGIYTIRQSRLANQKRLGYKIESNSPVIGSNALGKDGWEISYEGVAVVDPFVMEILIKNSGKVPIIESDFVRPDGELTILPGTQARFVTVSEIQTYVDGLKPLPAITETRIQIEPLLLNQGDSFKLVIVTDGKASPNVTARIIGVEKGVEKLTEDAKFRLSGPGLYGIAALLALYPLLVYVSEPGSSSLLMLAIVLPALILLAELILTMWKSSMGPIKAYLNRN